MEKRNDLNKLKDNYVNENAYICKNLFYFYVDQDSTFGTTDNVLGFVPINYSVLENKKANLRYRINHLPEEYKDWKSNFEKKLKYLETCEEDKRTNISSMECAPF